jgi:hypothetical protein
MLAFLSNISVNNGNALVVVFRGQKWGYIFRKLSECAVLLLAVLLLVRDQIYDADGTNIGKKRKKANSQLHLKHHCRQNNDYRRTNRSKQSLPS